MDVYPIHGARTLKQQVLPTFADEQLRLQSFSSNGIQWPSSNVSPIDLAKQGFFCFSEQAIVCYYCSAKVEIFKKGQDIDFQHRRFAQKPCPLLRKLDLQKARSSSAVTVPQDPKSALLIEKLESKIARLTRRNQALKAENRYGNFLRTRINQLEADTDLLNERINCKICFIV